MDDLFVRLEACKTLPTMPGVAMELLRVCRDPDVDMRAISDTVSRDPALAAKILRTANSSVYKRRIEVKTMQQAVAMLGVGAITTLALSFSLVRNKGTSNFDHNSFWTRSLFSAVASRSLARRLGMDPEQLFLAGLIQDLGILALSMAIPEYGTITKDAVDHEALGVKECEAFGANHAEVTAWLARRWRLPEFIADAALGSHLPIHEPTEPLITRCVAVSGWVAGIWTGNSAVLATRDAALRASSWLEMDRSTFHDVLADVVRDAPELGRLLDIAIEDGAELEAIATHARTALAAVSFRSPESDRKLATPVTT